MAFPILWQGLKNPIISFEYFSLKDQCVYFDEGSGWFYVLSSVSGPDWFYLRTKDFLSFDKLRYPVFGSSPDIMEHGGMYYITSQKRRIIINPFRWIYDKLGFRDINIFALSELGNKNLIPNVYVFDKYTIPRRNIDGCLYFDKTKCRFILTYKRCQKPRMAVFNPAINNGGTFIEEKRLDIVEGWAENFQVLDINNEIRLVATARKSGVWSGDAYTGNHFPFIYNYYPALANASYKKELEVPQEKWNKVMKANSPYLCDWRKYDGFFYLFYAGSNDNVSFNKRGHCSIGVARSIDLENWEVP